MINEKKIIILTNNVEIIKETKKVLENINVISTLFPKECIEKIKKENFKCIIIDEDLNEESGINVIKEIKKIHKNLPSLALINKKNTFLEKHYIEDGFDDFLIKEDYIKEINKIKKYL